MRILAVSSAEAAFDFRCGTALMTGAGGRRTSSGGAFGAGNDGSSISAVLAYCFLICHPSIVQMVRSTMKAPCHSRYRPAFLKRCCFGCFCLERVKKVVTSAIELSE